MGEYKLNYENAAEHLKQMPWPPKVQTEEGQEPFDLTELDINWVFCTMLGMKWLDACEIKDLTHRKFLYNKSMMLAEDVSKQRMAVDQRRVELEAALDEKVKQLGMDNVAPAEHPPDALSLDVPPVEESIPMNAGLKL